MFNLNVNGQSETDFCKKWDLEGYIYWGFTFSPEEKEKNDYLIFNKNGTFKSVDEGKFEKGTWKWNANDKELLLYDEKSDDPLSFKLIKLSNNELILLLEDEKDSIKLKFKSGK